MLLLHMSKPALSAFILLCWLNPAAIPQTLVMGTGVITGAVLDGNGQPVVGATVRLADAPVRAIDLDRATTAVTDERGKFVISGVKWGIYTLQAMKPEDGYPDPFVQFYRPAGAQPTVSISEYRPNEDVIVPIGPKAGSVEITVKDAVTGKPVGGAEARLRRWRAPFYSVSVPADGKVVIPSGVGIDLEVHAEGYEEWHYFSSGNGVKPGALEMAPGEKRIVEVRLRPLPGR